jgi:hypothetical protein
MAFYEGAREYFEVSRDPIVHLSEGHNGDRGLRAYKYAER